MQLLGAGILLTTRKSRQAGFVADIELERVIGRYNQRAARATDDQTVTDLRLARPVAGDAMLMNIEIERQR